MKNRNFLFLLFSLLCVIPAEAGFFGAKNTHVLRSDSVGIKLLNDHLYYTDSRHTTIISKKTSGNALSVAPNSSVFLYIPYGDTLTVQGGPGKGIYPGGAAIRVPGSSVLYILGGGTLRAKGGAAGLGTRGLDGTQGRIENRYFWGGSGGAGGNGGGGAGAGIGGNGGMGGYGGAGVASMKTNLGSEDAEGGFSDDYDDGIQGTNGGNSESGEDCGKVYLAGSLDIVALTGDTCHVFNGSAMGYNTRKKEVNGYDYAAGGGGGGGNGNNGLQGSKIGGGGPGAAGAGAGSTGACSSYSRCTTSLLLEKLAAKFTQVVIDAIVTAVTRNPKTLAAIVINVPGTDFKIKYTPGQAVSDALSQFFHFDFEPIQINGGGGYGSDKDTAPAPIVSGVGFYMGDSEIESALEEDRTIKPYPGGEAGKFGNIGALLRASCTSQVRVNQDMDKLTKENMPEELKKALTFSMKFDNTGVETLMHPYQKDTTIMYSNELPKVIVPTSPYGDQFKGYCDETGRYWYDDKGEPLATAKDAHGKDLKIYVHPGDITLYPQWSSYYALVVRHWLEAPMPKDYANDGVIDTTRYFVQDYEMYLCESDAGKDYAEKTVTCHNYANFDLNGDKLNQTITMKDHNRIYTADFFYDRRSYSLIWSLPEGTEIVEDNSYTKSGQIPFGMTIVAPQHAMTTNSGTYQFLKGWKERDINVEINQIDTMPAHDIIYDAVMEPIPVAMGFNNDPHYGTFKEPQSKNLGQQILFTVTPKAGYEVDTCYATIYTPYGARIEKVLQTQQGEVIPGSFDMDSIAVDIRYKGAPHKLAYKESTAARIGKLTMYLDGDSIYSGMDNTLTIRNGNTVWLRPERSTILEGNVCRSLTVRTASGKVIPATYHESYNQNDQCEYYWSFIAPDEDIEAVATYGTLSENQVKTTVQISKPDECEFKAYCNRGELLDNNYLLDSNTGYMLEPDQILWFEANSRSRIDTVIVNVDGDKSYSVEPNAYIFMHRDANDKDLTKAPQLIYRYAIQLPESAKTSVEIKIVNGNRDTAIKDINGLDISNPRTDSRYYDVYGNCWGSDPDNIPAGTYILNGRKFIKK